MLLRSSISFSTGFLSRKSFGMASQRECSSGTLNIFSRLLKERIICLNGQIDDDISAVVTAQLLYLEAEDPDKPISLYINSPGGVVTAGMAIYDTMQYVRPPITTVCMGQAASMASLLLAAGSPGHRFTLPNAQIMVHQPSGGMRGQAADLEISARHILNLRHRLNLLYSHHTSQPLEMVEQKMDRDHFMTPDQAVEFGLVDTVMTSRKLLAQREGSGGDGGGDGGGGSGGGGGGGGRGGFDDSKDEDDEEEEKLMGGVV